MIARKRIAIESSRLAENDMDELEQRNTFAWAVALSMMKIAASGHKPKDVKWGKLEGLESISFAAHPKDENDSARLIFRRTKEALEVIAVSDDHDEAYRRARSRVKPKA